MGVWWWWGGGAGGGGGVDLTLPRGPGGKLTEWKIAGWLRLAQTARCG